MLPLISIGDIEIPTYFLLISIGFSLAAYYLYIRADRAQLSTAIALDFSLALMLGSFLGSRLFHVIYEAPEYYREEPFAIFWIWQGGFVFYGGFIGAVFFGLLFLKIKKQPPLLWLDHLAMVFPPIYALGRLATLLSGSGYGRPTDLPWAIVYPSGSEAPAGIGLHPTPIYSILWSLGLWGVLFLLDRHREKMAFMYAKGQVFWVTVGGYSLGRLIIEQFRNDPRGAEVLSLSVSSWISLGLILFSVILFFKGAKTASQD